MKQDEIQIWMLIAFTLALVLSLYKVYIFFNSPSDDIDTETEHEELRGLIIAFIADNPSFQFSEKALFESLIATDEFDSTRYKNFNLNRYYQLIQQLFYIYDVHSFSELIISIRTARADDA